MAFAAGVVFSYQEDDLTSSHTVQRYPLGFAAALDDDTNPYDCVFVYVQATGSGATAYTPQQIGPFFQIEPPADAKGNIKVVCPQFDFGPNEYGFAQYRGECKGNVLASADGMLINHYFKADVSIGDAFYDVGGTITNQTYGSVLENLTGDEEKVIDICLLGKEAAITL